MVRQGTIRRRAVLTTARAWGGRILPAMAISWLALPLSTASAQDAPTSPISVSEAVWTDGIVQLHYQSKLESAKEGAQLYLWLKLRGDTQALELIRASSGLPIRLRWTWFVGESAIGDSGSLVDEFSINAGRAEELRKLEWQVARKGYFEWRTWGNKQNIRPGYWEVELLFAAGPQRGQPVLCGPERRPCKYSIHVD